MRAPVRWAVAASAAALILAGTAAVPARATPITTPTIDSPASGSTLVGGVTVAITSGAASVQVSLRSPVWDSYAWTVATADVVDGTAHVLLQSWGYPNGDAQLEVRDCDTSCSSAAAVLPVVLANEAPLITSPLPYSTVSGIITPTASTPEGGLVFDVEPRYNASVTDLQAPFSAQYDVADFPDGPKSLVVTRCSDTSCAGPSSTIPLTFVSLHPRITSHAPHTFSPNGDGVRDRVTLTLQLETAQTVTWEVRRWQSGRGPVVKPAVSLGRLLAGTYRIPWGGRDRYGHVVADGQYSIVVRTSERWKKGKAVQGFNVDRTPPTVVYRSGAGSTFYPYADGFKDRFLPKVGTGDAGPGYDVAMTIARPDGSIVRRLDAIAWNGRYASGAAVPAGRYRWRASAVDRGGNVSRTAWYDVYVSWRRTKDVTFTLTVPAASGTVSVDAACASETVSAFPGGLALSNECASAADRVAAYADYTLTVPPAAGYTSLTVRLDVGSTTGYGLQAGVISATGGRRTDQPQQAYPTGWWNGYSVTPPGSAVGPDRVVRPCFLLRNTDAPSTADIRQVQVVVRAKVFT